MSAIDILSRILKDDNLKYYPFRYCLVDSNKIPYNLVDERAKPNDPRDFSDIGDVLMKENLYDYIGLGISVKESNICAIDVDKCFKIPNDVKSADERAIEIINLFKDYAYIEFSFSGTGLRIIFSMDLNIENYLSKYYVKNEKTQIEFYQPTGSARYVTITGNCLFSNPIKQENNNKALQETILTFLNKYMCRQQITRSEPKTSENEDLDLNTLKQKVKYYYLKNSSFQNKWFSTPSGSNGNESETDFAILTFLYNFVTRDKEKIKLLFESSPYFKKKDNKHIYKWEAMNNRYYNYLYSRINGS